MSTALAILAASPMLALCVALWRTNRNAHRMARSARMYSARFSMEWSPVSWEHISATEMAHALESEAEDWTHRVDGTEA